MTTTYPHDVRTVVLGPRPPEIEALIERRRRLGQDTYDEIWQGDYHMAPQAHFWHGYVDRQIGVILEPLVRARGLVQTGPFNLGQAGDFRVPDGGVHGRVIDSAWASTALLVVEVLSPDDESWEKLPFYAGRGVREVLMVDPREATIVCLRARDDHGWTEVDRSDVLDVAVADLVSAIRWPGRTGS
jgi:Uma2 family endonuclease